MKLILDPFLLEFAALRHSEFEWLEELSILKVWALDYGEPMLFFEIRLDRPLCFNVDTYPFKSLNYQLRHQWLHRLVDFSSHIPEPILQTQKGGNIYADTTEKRDLAYSTL